MRAAPFVLRWAAVNVVAKMDDLRRTPLERNAIENGGMQLAQLVRFAMHIADCEIDRPGHAVFLPCQGRDGSLCALPQVSGIRRG